MECLGQTRRDARSNILAPSDAARTTADAPNVKNEHLMSADTGPTYYPSDKVDSSVRSDRARGARCAQKYNKRRACLCTSLDSQQSEHEVLESGLDVSILPNVSF